METHKATGAEKKKAERLNKMTFPKINMDPIFDPKAINESRFDYCMRYKDYE